MLFRALILFLLSIPVCAEAQEYFHGVVLSKSGEPIQDCGIHKGKGNNLTYTDSLGRFTLPIPKVEVFTFFGYVGLKKIFGYRLEVGKGSYPTSDTIIEGQGFDILPHVEIDIGSDRPPFLEEIRPRDLALNPAVGGSVEALIKTLGGVSSGNELSSQYTVRGGNFDENLIYVNDIEIFRPQLIHSGQQEGLSFINPDLVKTIKFSAGGFEAQYGDKMSSVLDVEYLKPDSFGSRVNLGIMLNTASFEGRKNKLSYIAGIRYYTNSLLTRSLDLKGSYNMHFGDFQTMLAYKFSPRFQMEFLGNLALNRYSLVPESRRTTFGTIQTAYQLDVYLGGAENMDYNYGMGALTLKYRIDPRKELKLILAATGTDEQEYFDVEGAYNLSLLDKDLGSSNLGKPLKTLGFGYFLDHGRNKLRSGIYNISQIGTFGKNGDRNIFKYGVRAYYEVVNDRYKEWRYNDSDDYNIPPFGFATDSIILDDQVSATNSIGNFRAQAYVQDRYRLSKEDNMWLGTGLRANWWQWNNQLFVTPRVNFSYEPNRRFNRNLPDSLKKNDVVIKLAAGGYYQPAFYRELRNFQGVLNHNLKAQQSWHFVAGMDRYFNMWDRRFKFSSEGYYKYMTMLNPYLYDNIRIRYYANNNGEGYAWGWDNRINGEFVPNLESWFTLSLLQTREKITYQDENGNWVQSDWLRRPTDRRINFAAIFQDELPMNPTFRANLNLLIGSGIPYYLNGQARYTSTPNTIPPYRRLDLGMSKVLVGHPRQKKINERFKTIKQAWISFEFFNLLAINNVIAYSWVKDLSNNTYGVPEYLTGRRINIRLHAEF